MGYIYISPKHTDSYFDPNTLLKGYSAAFSKNVINQNVNENTEAYIKSIPGIFTLYPGTTSMSSKKSKISIYTDSYIICSRREYEGKGIDIPKES